MKEKEPSRQESWLLSSYNFNNGFWQDKRETLNQTFRKGGEKIHLRSNFWKIYRNGKLIATAQETVLGETGLPVIIVTPLENIDPEDKKALSIALEQYHAQREGTLKI